MTSFNNNNSIIDTTLSHYIKLQIQYGSDLYELLLSRKDNKIRVEHVLDEIEKLTKVPKCHQTIMYKGQRLDHKPQANLDDLYIFNNSKLILSGTQKQFHDKYCCPNHDHNVTNTSLPKLISSQKQNNTTNINEEKLQITIKSNNDIDDSSVIKTQTPLVFKKKQEINSNLTGFVPEANKTYE
ncbi:unnamed protein product [Rotaria sp. Silwood2]|nr:unnamed protein product [Rotaria sp. Silwood2]CAF2536480.1 unnamed protein product [Rotaria sp. Silwood2]CAF2788686.1 unnamed protein product [Rotaria sp. Silwood2]CAF2933719.1 unnamed protein product [Rotaria sp. Silwood2]CAF4087390.1 unnamed protein product [Rotaria sp. Silwood2]